MSNVPAPYEAARLQMVSEQVRRRGIRDERVLAALSAVPRHRFVPEHLSAYAYDDHPLPIGHGQTISQPYMVALMTEVVAARPGERILEVGTGSGYQSAVLLALGAEVFSIERFADLSRGAARVLDELGYGARFHPRVGDGTEGWAEDSPFDAIIVTAAARAIPRRLLGQLGEHGRLVLPLGDEKLQGLVRVRRTPAGWQDEYFGECRFVKLFGDGGWDES